MTSAIVATLTTVVDVASAVLILLSLQGIIAEVLRQTGVPLTLKIVFEILGTEAITVAFEQINDTQAMALLIKTALCSFAAVQISNEKNPSSAGVPISMGVRANTRKGLTNNVGAVVKSNRGVTGERKVSLFM